VQASGKRLQGIRSPAGRETGMRVCRYVRLLRKGWAQGTTPIARPLAGSFPEYICLPCISAMVRMPCPVESG
jgi:hypothetical protein